MAALVKPYYEQGGITIYHGDARDILRCLRADVVVTDPPFGIGFHYGTYDDSPLVYGDLMRDWIALTQNEVGATVFFVWQAMLNAGRWHEWFPDGYRIFAACRGFTQYLPHSVQNSWDPVIFWGNVTGEPNVSRKDWHVQSLAPFGAGRERIPHPCPRPLEQVQYVVRLASETTQIILDPFMGSGTTLRAAKDLGRKAIGIEIEERYCEIAAKRLEQECLPFVSAPERTEVQGSLLEPVQ